MKKSWNNTLLGLGLILVGLVLVLQNFNIPYLDNLDLGELIGIFWPLFILVPAVKSLRRGFRFWNIFALVMGTAFLVENIGDFLDMDLETSFIFQLFWPVMLIVIGVGILRKRGNSADSDDELFTP